MASGVALSVAGVVAGGMALGVALGMAKVVALGVAVGVTLGVTLGMVYGVAVGVATGMMIGMVVGVAILRPDSWLLSTLAGSLRSKTDVLSMAFITPLSLPLSRHILQQNSVDSWLTVTHNANQLLAYTYQFIPVINSLNKLLAQMPEEQVIAKLSQLAQAPFDWQLIEFNSASLENAIKAKFVQSLFILPFRKRALSRLNTSPRLDTSARAAAAGFWYLHAEQPAQAAQAFAVVRDIRHGEEMYGLASLLALFNAAETAEQIAAIELLELPPDRTLRPQTWEAIDRLYQVISDTKTAQARAFATVHALGKLQHIIDHPTDLPEAERALVIEIAKTWRHALLDITAAVGDINLT
jgi:hypothetical protein